MNITYRVIGVADNKRAETELGRLALEGYSLIFVAPAESCIVYVLSRNEPMEPHS